MKVCCRRTFSVTWGCKFVIHFWALIKLLLAYYNLPLDNVKNYVIFFLSISIWSLDNISHRLSTVLWKCRQNAFSKLMKKSGILIVTVLTKGIFSVVYSILGDLRPNPLTPSLLWYTSLPWGISSCYIATPAFDWGFKTCNRPTLILMLLVATLVDTKWCKNPEKWPKPWQMGTHLIVLIKSVPMNTNMTGFRWFWRKFAFLCFGRK